MSSYLFKTEFREYPAILRRAISVGRRIQDPVAEFSALCVDEDELLCLRLHPRQVLFILLASVISSRHCCSIVAVITCEQWNLNKGSLSWVGLPSRGPETVL